LTVVGVLVDLIPIAKQFGATEGLNPKDFTKPIQEVRQCFIY
jgi:hypothetical protein